MVKINVITGQSIIDIALQVYGTEEGAISIFLNSDSIESINNSLTTGQVLEIDQEIKPNALPQYLTDKKLNIVTSDTNKVYGSGFDFGFDGGFD
jgi:hypothetical protein